MEGDLLGYLYGPFLIGTSLFTGESMHDKFGWMFTLYTWICLSEQWTVNKRTYRKTNFVLEFFLRKVLFRYMVPWNHFDGDVYFYIRETGTKVKTKEFFTIIYVSMNFWFYCL